MPTGAPHLAAFVHVPLLQRDGASQRKGVTQRITLDELVDAGEAMLLEMVKLTRKARRVGKAKRAHPRSMVGTAQSAFAHYELQRLTLPPNIAPSHRLSAPCSAAFLRYFLRVRHIRTPAGTRDPWTSIAAI